MAEERYFPLELQISREAWRRLELAQEFREAVPSPLYALRVISDRLRRRRPGFTASAARLNMLALLSVIFRYMAGLYLEEKDVALAEDQAVLRRQRFPIPGLGRALNAFVRHFPPAEILFEGIVPDAFWRRGKAGHREHLTLVEMFVLAVQTDNTALAGYRELFDDASLHRDTPYRDILSLLDGHLEKIPGRDVLAGSLLRLLRSPIEASPDSLEGQLRYIRERWAGLLPPELLDRILIAFDVLAEEEALRGGGPGPVPVPRFGLAADYEEPERFSPDADWMANAVLIAKSVYVWLDQLARKYRRPITRLDEIPDEELDLVAGWGFTALWLIGLWERSPASQKIKQLMGNPEAVSSAYSLYDYAIAQDLGGEEAVANLEARCWHRGIRLACDVVPNHTGIFSKWVREHPDWFVQLDHPPYPGYRFNGPDLSFDGDLVIQIEDGYWDRSDAAVVFRHLDRRSGRMRYIYHGNDGTHMPWNDTAQLNFLLPEVREAMIRTIVHVARRFKIIRFDAAMTLAKKHYQRLWFPQPGGGAGVPSRSEHPMTREEFDRLFPGEFWREVVDRVAAEVPDTLLLAEAFWLMEGYFVRTLGMHRVYNSAFMNMLKSEDNAKYRGVLKNILEFNHEILGRFVNFMNNPDEATAVEQFGKGDKYFGVAVLLATMPGLPMFGHGQIEGFREKYGMEYRRAYWDETADESFVRHHEAQICPLLRRRRLFSGSSHFVLYDFDCGSFVNEDVFAYSNRWGGERSLVVFHNRYAGTEGRVHTSVGKRVREGGGERLARTTLAAELEIGAEGVSFLRFRDHRTGLEYLRSGSELADRGLHLHLGPYQYYVFLDFRTIRDEDGTWRRLHDALNGQPAADLDRQWKKIRYAPLHEALHRAVAPELLTRIGRLFIGEPRPARDEEDVLSDFAKEAEGFLSVLATTTGAAGNPSLLARKIREDVTAFRRLVASKSRLKREREALAALAAGLPRKEEIRREPRDQFYRIFLPWLVLRRCGELDPAPGAVERSTAWLEEFLLIEVLAAALQAQSAPPFNLHRPAADIEARLAALLVRCQAAFGSRPEEGVRFPAALLDDPQVQEYLGCNWYGGVRWFNKERLETLLYWLFVTQTAAAAEAPRTALSRAAELHRSLHAWLEAAAAARYRLDIFRQLL